MTEHFYTIKLSLEKEFLLYLYSQDVLSKRVKGYGSSREFFASKAQYPIEATFKGLSGREFSSEAAVSSFIPSYKGLLKKREIDDVHFDQLLYIAGLFNEFEYEESIVLNRENELKELEKLFVALLKFQSHEVKLQSEYGFWHKKQGEQGNEYEVTKEWVESNTNQSLPAAYYKGHYIGVSDHYAITYSPDIQIELIRGSEQLASKGTTSNQRPTRLTLPAAVTSPLLTWLTEYIILLDFYSSYYLIR